MFEGDDMRWGAVTARDASADGRFVYSVASTGVYCKPSCASRQARRANVAFHDGPDAAEQAGFRACKRCRPREGAAHVRTVTELCRFIETAESIPSLAELSRRAGLSPHHLHRVFKAVTGVTPRAYAAEQRARRIRASLLRDEPVTQAIHDAGYASSGRFYEESDARLGMTPSRYRKGGSQMEIRFAVGECSLGSILVAASEKGVCAVLMGDAPEPLVHDLEARFPAAILKGADGSFESLVAQVVGLVERPSGPSDGLPLDVRGTLFQQRVWEALRSIPAGTTATYAQVAQKLGLPKSVRAVAGACGANPVAVAIPCHRVVRSDGSLSGYRWGIERKKTLLEREGSR